MILLCVFVSTNASSQLFSLPNASSAPRLFHLTDEVVKLLPPLGALDQYLAVPNLTALAASEVTFELPHGDVTMSEVRRSENSWRGCADVSCTDFAIFSVYDGKIAGLIRSGGLVYELQYRKGQTVLRLVDRSSLPPEDSPLSVAPIESQEALSVRSPRSQGLVVMNQGSSACSGIVEVDVAYEYTQRVLNNLGSSGVQLLIQQIIDVSNMVYEDSNVLVRLNLVGTRLASYVEPVGGATGSEALGALAADQDAEDFKGSVGADILGRLVDLTGSCGQGYVMGDPPSSSFGQFALHVVEYEVCAVPNFSAPHEIGHNQGLQHNPENAGTTPSRPYAYGHRIDHVSQGFRTVLALSSGCSNCPREGFLSNPDQLTGIEDQRDNARALNENRCIVRDFEIQETIFTDGFESGTTSAWN